MGCIQTLQSEKSERTVVENEEQALTQNEDKVKEKDGNDDNDENNMKQGFLTKENKEIKEIKEHKDVKIENTEDLNETNIKLISKGMVMTKNELLFAGFFREFHETTKINIPSNIQTMTVQYYPLLTVFGIGLNLFSGFDLILDINKSDKYTKLEQLSKLMANAFAKDVYCNNGNIIVRTLFGEIFVVGNNQQGQLGLGSDGNDIKEFTKSDIDGLSKSDCIDFVSNGIDNIHTFMYSMDGELFVCGGNKHGMHGNGTKYYAEKKWKTVPVDFLKEKERLISIQCGRKHSIFLSNAGKVYSCGSNERAQCGQPSGVMSTDEIWTPTMIEALRNVNIIQICCGMFHNLLVDDLNNLWVFGDNQCGQLGIMKDENNDNDIIKSLYNPKKNPFFDNICVDNIRCGLHHSLCIDKFGKCHLFGYNDCGQIGNGHSFDNTVFNPYLLPLKKGIIDAECGSHHNVLLTENNDIITFGDNYHNQCSSINKEHQIRTPYFINKEQEIGIDENDTIHKVLAQSQNTLIVF